MFTALLLYYGACALGMAGATKFLNHVADNCKESGNPNGYESPYGDNVALDGEPYGMPYWP